MRSLRLLVVLLLAGVAYACSDSTGSEDSKGTIRVTVQDETNLGVSGAAVTLRRGSITRVATSDVAGFAIFEDVVSGEWAIEMDSPPQGYTITTTMPVAFNLNSGQVKIVTVRLLKNDTPPKEPPIGEN